MVPLDPSTSIWSAGTVNIPSCTAPKVDPNAPKMCDGDPTSIALSVTKAPECIYSTTGSCRFSMYDFEQLDATIDMQDCLGTWAAPFWMTPDHWEGGGTSGEVDMVEMCPMTKVCANFAAGGHQVCYDYNPNNFHGHVTMWKDPSGRVSVKICPGDSPCSRDGPAPIAVYDNVYASHACTSGQDCTYRLMSDIWLGTAGDEGWRTCGKAGFNPNSKCAISVKGIKIQSKKPFEGKCASLNVQDAGTQVQAGSLQMAMA